MKNKKPTLNYRDKFYELSHKFDKSNKDSDNDSILYVIPESEIHIIEWDNGIRYPLMIRIKQKMNFRLFKIKYWLRKKFK